MGQDWPDRLAGADQPDRLAGQGPGLFRGRWAGFVRQMGEERPEGGEDCLGKCAGNRAVTSRMDSAEMVFRIRLRVLGMGSQP